MKDMFNMTWEQIKKQIGTRKDYDVDPESKFSPITPGDTFLEPCIRGGEKMLNDSEKRGMFYRIYRGKNRDSKDKK